MIPGPTASTRLVALLGWPARHSLSPVMHNAAFAEQGLDLVYLALPTPPDRLRTVVDALAATGAVGANVTVPHKQAVVPLCDHLTDEAALIGAVNTLAWTTDGLVGDNTDARGLHDVLRDDLGLRSGLRAVVLGTGGGARAAAVALGRLAATVAVVGRDGAAAEDLAALAGDAGSEDWTSAPLDDPGEVTRLVEGAELVINATPLGMAGERLPEPFHALRSDQVAYDLVYRPPDTPFLADAAAAGAESHHGLGMLIAQAALSYRRWTGRAAPTATLSAAALAALADRGNATA